MHRQPSRKEIAAIIAAAARASAESLPFPEKTEEKKAGERKSSSGKREKGERERSSKKPSKEEREANKEKKLKKLVAAIVVKCMSKYQKYMDHDVFKKYAKEVGRINYSRVLSLL